MPRGKLGISGASWVPAPVDFNQDQKNRLLGVLENRRVYVGSGILSEGLRESAWSRINELVADYAGQHRGGRPPTEGRRTNEVNRIKKQAQRVASKLRNLDAQRADRVAGALEKLDRLLRSSNIHTRDLLTKALTYVPSTSLREPPLGFRSKLCRLASAIQYNGLRSDEVRSFAGLGLLIEQVANLSEVDTSIVRVPKGYPDPFLQELFRGLAQVWIDATGEIPGRVYDHYADPGFEEEFPLLEWVDDLLSFLNVGPTRGVSSWLARRWLALEKIDSPLSKTPQNPSI